MVFQLNLNYIRSNRGAVITAEASLGLIGGIMTAVVPSGFLAFSLWSTLTVSGAILLLNILNVYQLLHAKFSFLVKVELGYVAVWALFYLIATIISFIPTLWTIGAIIGYIELALFLMDGFLHFRVHRGEGGGNAPPADRGHSFGHQISIIDIPS